MSLPHIVVDASVAGAWLFNEIYSTRAKPILQAIEQRRVIALAPDRFEEEMLRICQKKLLPPPIGAGIPAKDSFDRFLDLMTAPIPVYLLPSRELHERDWQLAVSRTGLTTHDALYLSLAEKWGAELWTTDGPLGRQAGFPSKLVWNLATDAFPY